MNRAEQVRLHIAALRGRGWSRSAIAARAGLSRNTICRYVHGIHDPHPDAARYVLGIPLDEIPRHVDARTGEPFVPRIGTVRRLQALMSIGYSHTSLASEGIDSRNLISQPGLWVLRSTHDRVAATYRRLCTRPGPSTRAVLEAAKRGYAGPMDWDDIDRDAEPDLEQEAS